MGLILVVSEDLVEIETIKTALSVHGWWVTVAADRQTALQVAADQAPKLVVVDGELPDSLDLVRSFGSSNGGPGVLSCVPPDFDRALDFKQAGGDELLTKPVAPASVLEAVQRCLAGPRVEPATRATPSNLLTTEEIFGDVLREIELGDEAVETAPSPEPSPEPPRLPNPESTPSREPAPEPAPATIAEEVVLAPEPAPEQVVSLAGLFDETDEPEGEPVPIPALQAGDARGREDGWSGEERRSVGRPWSGPAPDPAEARPAEAEPAEVEPAAPQPEGDVLFTPSMPRVEGEALRADLDWIDELEDDVKEDAEVPPEASGEAGRPFPRAAVAIGALAAVLLLAVGILLFVNRGGEPEGVAPDSPATVESETLRPSEARATGGAEAPERQAQSGEGRPLAEPEALAGSDSSGEADELEDLNLQAIVDQELERREEELRRVFLEEEKRLLRELNNLDPDEEPPAEDGEGDSTDRSGVGL